MPRLTILSLAEQRKYNLPPEIKTSNKPVYFNNLGQFEDRIFNMRGDNNKICFIIQLGYFLASGRFYAPTTFRDKDIKYVSCIHNLNESKFTPIKYDHQTKLNHQDIIRRSLGWKKFTPKAKSRLMKELLWHAKRSESPIGLFHCAIKYLISDKTELPAYTTLSDCIRDAYTNYEHALIEIVDKNINKSGKKILDDFIKIEDARRKHNKISVLAITKKELLSVQNKDIEDSLISYNVYKEIYDKFVSIYSELAVPEETINYYALWVKKSKIYQLKQFKDRNKAYLYILLYIKYQLFRRTDALIFTFIKATNNSVNSALKKLSDLQSSNSKDTSDVMNKLEKNFNLSEETIDEIDAIAKNSNLTPEKKINTIDNVIKQYRKDNSPLSEKERGLCKANSLKCNKTQAYKDVSNSLQRKVSKIVLAMEFRYRFCRKSLKIAIESFIDNNGNVTKKSPIGFLSKAEKLIVCGESKKEKFRIGIYKTFLFKHIADSIKSGMLTLAHTFAYVPLNDLLVSDVHWLEDKKELLRDNSLSHLSSINDVVNDMESAIDKLFFEINKSIEDKTNKDLKIKNDGNFTVSTPAVKKIDEDSISSLITDKSLIPILNILSDINRVCDFTSCFKHHSIKSAKMNPSVETIFAGILARGCNHGIRKMANISKGVTEDILRNTVNWFFSYENLQKSINKVINVINSIDLPNIYLKERRGLHTSSDGQKITVNAKSLLAGYSYKYYGKDQGVSIYSFIDERNILFYDTVISPSEREAGYVLDGLLSSNVNSTLHSTDTHGFTEVIFGITHLLGFSFAPRIKGVGKQYRYSFKSIKHYKDLEYKILPKKKINTNAIVDNWDEILKLAVSIKSKRVQPSEILHRIGASSPDNGLLKGLKEFGRACKTIYILSFAENRYLRQQIEKQLNKIELSNRFRKAIFFANNQEFKSGLKDEQEITIACQSLIQNCIVLWNYLFLSSILCDDDINDVEKNKVLSIIKSGSVLSWRHINLHGEYDFTKAASNDKAFDMEKIYKLKVLGTG